MIVYCSNCLLPKNKPDLYLNETQEIVDFLYLHYVTNKKNTIFWKNFIKNNKTPEKIMYILNVCKDKVLNSKFDLLNNPIFVLPSYNYILIGNKIINNEIMKKNSKFILDDIKINDYENIIKNQKIIIPKFLTHNDFIDIIKAQGKNVKIFYM